MASPYSSHSSGVPSPPTVVSDYNRTVDVINPDSPHLVVIEQPQSKFRFRYKSEMVGTHGQLKAERADRNKPIFPTVKLMKWRDGPALIRLALYTGEDNINQRTRHVHELGGKNCDKDTGVCEMVIDQNSDYTASFQNLGIIHIAKRDVKDIIKQRKKKELIEHIHLRQPHRSLEEIKQSVTPTDMKKFEEEAEEIAKCMDLNKVVLRFQAFYYDTSVDCYRALTKPVDSELVVNLKNASTGELKIVRMSECAGDCTGGTVVWMLVEKVKKNNIKIKFYELDADYKEVWSAYGEFSEADVHHQYAIVFRTPPYRTSNLKQSVRVKVQLERPNDKDMSEPRDFTYYPTCTLSTKRRNEMDTTKTEDDEDYSHGGGNNGRSIKKQRHGSTEPLDLRNSSAMNGNNGPIDGILGAYDCFNGIYNFAAKPLNENISMLNYMNSPPYTVPSPNHPGASPNSNSNHSFYNSNNNATTFGAAQNGGQVPQIQVTVENNASFMFSPTSSVASSGMNGNVQMLSPSYQAPSPQGINNNFNQPLSPVYHNTPSPQSSHLQSPSPSYPNNLSPGYQNLNPSNDYQMVPKSPDDGFNTNSMLAQQLGSGQNTTNIVQPTVQNSQQMRPNVSNQQNPVQMGTLNTPTINDQDCDWNFQNLLQSNEGYHLNGIDLADESSLSLENINPDLFGVSDLQTDCMKEKVSSKTDKQGKMSKQVPQNVKPCGNISSVEDLSDALGSVRISEKNFATSLMKQKIVPGSVDVAFLVAISAAESLQAYAATGDMGLLLATHRYLLAVQNNQGDNALHTAVSYKNWEAFNKILAAAQKLKHELLNTQNFAGQTPLHLAVDAGELAMAERLLLISGTNISLTDRNGDTPIHIAARLASSMPKSPYTDIMARLLSKSRDNPGNDTLENALEAYNYQGETAMHIAVVTNNIVAVKQLTSAGANVHLCERRRGANCLHLAAQYHCLEIAHFLIKNTTITVNSRMFDGNTALHIAAQEGNALMCKILMEAGADPYAKNSIKIQKSSSKDLKDEDDKEDSDSDESDNDDDEYEDNDLDCYTPLDYASNNLEVLKVLESENTNQQEIPSKDKSEQPESIMDSGICVSASDIT